MKWVQAQCTACGEDFPALSPPDRPLPFTHLGVTRRQGPDVSRHRLISPSVYLPRCGDPGAGYAVARSREQRYSEKAGTSQVRSPRRARVTPVHQTEFQSPLRVARPRQDAGEVLNTREGRGRRRKPATEIWPPERSFPSSQGETPIGRAERREREMCPQGSPTLGPPYGAPNIGEQGELVSRMVKGFTKDRE